MNTRLHGNGFIQVDIGPDLRLHVWSKKAPQAQNVYTPIHNHSFSFLSRIIKGRLMNKVYQTCPGQSHKVYVAITRDHQDTRLEACGLTSGVLLETDHIYEAGADYSFPAGEFHESVPLENPTVTIMRKVAKHHLILPLVLVPRDIEPDNDFNRYRHGEEALDKIVMEALKGVTVPWLR
jgi:hypothetical protein